MEENLKRVLEKIIVPAYDEIESVRVTQMSSKNFYLVKYKIIPPLDAKDAYEIVDETTNLFKMMGLGRSGDIIVDFVKK